VTGETAVFDTKTNLVTMLGGVILTRARTCSARSADGGHDHGRCRGWNPIPARAGAVSVLGPGRPGAARRFAVAGTSGPRVRTINRIISRLANWPPWTRLKPAA